jgi:phage terminase large subunit
MKINEKYKPILTTDKRYILITGGRGSGKSFFANLFLCLMLFWKNTKILFTRWTMKSAYDSIIPEFIEKLELIKKIGLFNINKDEITLKVKENKILFRGIKTSEGNQTANLKSLPGINIWANDEGEELIDEETYDTIDLSVRKKGVVNRIISILNPSNVHHFIYKKYIKDTHKIETIDGVEVEISTHPDVLHIHTTYLDNIENLSEDWLKNVREMKIKNPSKYAHKVIGAWKRDTEGAIWDQATIDKHRVKEAPKNMKEIIIAIDPAVSTNPDSDDTGIIVGGLCYDGDVYVWGDFTGKYKPSGWAKIAVNQLTIENGDKIIAEVNNGGDMVESTIRGIDNSVPYDTVWASRGKKTRAEPVEVLYDQGKVHHVGYLTKLEKEQTTWIPDSGMPSPNRMDALVWLVTYLLVGKNNNEYAVA